MDNYGVGMRSIGIACGLAASLLCIVAGISLLCGAELSTGLGLYFIGKGLFVGPMLIITVLMKIGCDRFSGKGKEELPDEKA
ncbi:MAG: hypothetical protein CVT48_06390 [Thermoplasmata archaeon HGW-Thermoplasmata-1]|nr:MAG: hypothetical protein CVT48_06390 [Thermoplasmata archaeon HGW-Thermoplasmata-1]